MINLCLIIAVYRCRGIIQGSQKICFNVSNLGRISIQTKQQAEQLKECSANGKLTQGYIYAVLLKKENSKINVTIPAKKIGNYFPETYSKEQIEEVIFMLLDKWKENREGVADAEDTV